jgi:protein O-GlcNAc transferase
MATSVNHSKGAGNGSPIRLLHHLARSGGTLISRCLASMQGVALLSEIHPAAAAVHYPIYDPLDQARRWYELFDAGEVATLGRTRPERFAAVIGLIEERCQARGLALVIRDWSHLDFIGVPYRRETGFKLETVEALKPQFALRRFATVRHPVTQWLSLRRIKGTSELTLERYLAGCHAFAEQAVAVGFVRYEDFTRTPAASLAEIARALDLAYDPGFVERWSSYRHMTGDVPEQDETAIVPWKPRPLPPGLAGRFASNDDYRRTIELLGYEHVG